MKFLNYVIKTSLIIIALLFTIIISRIVPKNQFESYRLELDSAWTKDAASQEYMVDLNNDAKPEILRHQKINKAGHSLELWNDKHFRMLNIFEKNEFVISQSLKFVDINGDGLKEIIFLTANKPCAYLNIIDYNYAGKGSPKGIQRIKVDSIKYYNDKPDAISYDLVVNKNNIWFNIQAAYSIQPRNIYKYNLQTQELLKTGRNSIVTKAFEIVNSDNQYFVLPTYVIATGNTVSPKESEMLKNSKDPDSIGYYHLTKNTIYQYGDFSSYILLYDHRLDFAFKPIEFNGWTNYTKSAVIYRDSIPNIVAIINTLKGDSTIKKIMICDLQGKIGKQIPLTDNYSEVFIDKNKIVFWGNNTLNVYSEKLEPIKKIQDITYGCGFYNMEGHHDKEFIAYKKNEICILSDDFQILTTFKIEQEFAPYPEENGIKLLQIGKKHCFVYNSRLFYYLFSYQKNELAIWKYPFYVAIFFVWLGVLMLILRFNSMRLEKEKQKLEETVDERTQELRYKNIELASQKEEIQTQTEKIKEQYERLEKLDQFKESLTHTLVHDLKNPLSQITLNNNSPAVQLSVRKMMMLITNMLDVEKYETTQFKLNKETHSIYEILQEIKKEQEISLEEKNLKLHLNFDDYMVKADKDIIKRVFDNLLSNAIRYSPLNQNIEVFAQKLDEDTVQIDIKNYGPTLPDEAIPTIFDKYRHFESTNNNSHRSTGLGLAFCKMAVEAHEQKITARNDANGVVFSFTLNGEKSSTQNIDIEDETPEIALTDTEKTVLKPYFERLKNFEVYQISDILKIWEEIPQESDNIKALKQQIRNAAFAGNEDFFNQIIHLVI